MSRSYSIYIEKIKKVEVQDNCGMRYPPISRQHDRATHAVFLECHCLDRMPAFHCIVFCTHTVFWIQSISWGSKAPQCCISYFLCFFKDIDRDYYPIEPKMLSELEFLSELHFFLTHFHFQLCNTEHIFTLLSLSSSYFCLTMSCGWSVSVAVVPFN